MFNTVHAVNAKYFLPLTAIKYDKTSHIYRNVSKPYK